MKIKGKGQNYVLSFCMIYGNSQKKQCNKYQKIISDQIDVSNDNLAQN